MELLKRGMSRVRKSLLYNALSSAMLTAVLASFLLTVWAGNVPLMVALVIPGWLWFCIFTIVAIVYQYGGAIDIYRGAGRESPLHPTTLKVAAILIIVDPLFNLLSGAGMFMLPYHRLSGETKRLWTWGIPFFFGGTLLTSLQLFLPFPGSGAPLEDMLLPLGVSVLSLALTMAGYIILYRVYKEAGPPATLGR